MQIVNKYQSTLRLCLRVPCMRESAHVPLLLVGPSGLLIAFHLSCNATLATEAMLFAEASVVVCYILLSWKTGIDDAPSNATRIPVVCKWTLLLVLHIIHYFVLVHLITRSSIFSSLYEYFQYMLHMHFKISHNYSLISSLQV